MAAASPAKKARIDSGDMAASATGSAPLTSWVEVPADCDWSIYNIPFGVFTPAAGGKPRPGTVIGTTVVDLAALADAGLFDAVYADTFKTTTLNAFMGAGRGAWRDARARLQALFTGSNPVLKDGAELQAAAFHPETSVTMHLPATIGDYTDFYSSREHATNVGTMFRGKDNALQPNWLHLPVGYHGRASSVVTSGTPVRRPQGQLQKDATDPKQGSTFGACRLFDFELEIGAFVGPGNDLGTPIPMDKAEENIFGLVLMNDWSARDIQKWEYVPLGPFTAKNVATSISPWVVTLDALEAFRCPTSAGAQTDPEPLPYLQDPTYSSYDVKLTVAIKPEGDDSAPEGHVVSTSNYRHMYWNVKQQLVHHTVTGCNMRPGDCYGSGTISGTTPDSFGSMLELSWKGTKPLTLPTGAVRKFLADGDEVIVKGHCEKDGVRVGFGACKGVVLPANPLPGAAASK